MTSMLTSAQLQQSFTDYDQFLATHSGLWQCNPFTYTHWPWSQSAEAIRTRLRQQLQLLTDPVAPLDALTTEQTAWPFWLTNGIQGRKLAQISGFIGQFDSQQAVLEWCSGKGHLGRLLSYQRLLPVTSLEWQKTLCEQGQALAQQHGIAQQFQHCDVLALTPGSLPNNCAMVALHACGDLHRRLLEQFTHSSGAELFLAPCCYHLQAASYYQPLSKYAQQSPLQLSKSDLKLAVQDFVTAGQRTARLRDTEQLWRLVFQEYRALLCGDPSYQPLPAISKQIFSGDISAFMAWACQQHGLKLPSAAELAELLPIAHQRLRLVRDIDDVRQLFRRPLELWLLLDRALYLSEHGYQVALKQFCPYQHSPRNTLIISRR
ncbi:MAG: Uncharacterised protein [Pseudidiomarina mangrovi]|nr:MAG: Uncharacterised protein [Pseudidiomarina mangrovi]